MADRVATAEVLCWRQVIAFCADRRCDGPISSAKSRLISMDQCGPPLDLTMDILTIAVGALSTNCYVVVPGGVTDGAECVVIDPGAEGPRIVGEIRSRGLVPRYVLCTHGHADHTGGVADIVTEFDASFGIGAGDVNEAVNPPPWLTGVLTDYARPPAPDHTFSGGEILEVGAANIEVLATPGHTPGSVCYGVGATVFTGDTLFKQSIGRYDLPGGDGPRELASIRDKLLVLDGETKVLPGHGPSTTIAEERINNPFLRQG